MAKERVDIPIIIDGRGDPHRRPRAERDAARPPARARRLSRATTQHVEQAIAASQARGGRVGELGVGGSRRGVPARRRAADDDVARHRERRDDARPVQDGVPGRDRFGVRADRLLAVQSRVRAGAVRRAADQQQHDVEPARLPAARRVRLRGDAVQLHVDRRQPADGAGADGEHGASGSPPRRRCSRRTTS